MLCSCRERLRIAYAAFPNYYNTAYKKSRRTFYYFLPFLIIEVLLLPLIRKTLLNAEILKQNEFTTKYLSKNSIVFEIRKL